MGCRSFDPAAGCYRTMIGVCVGVGNNLRMKGVGVGVGGWTTVTRVRASALVPLHRAVRT